MLRPALHATAISLSIGLGALATYGLWWCPRGFAGPLDLGATLATIIGLATAVACLPLCFLVARERIRPPLLLLSAPAVALLISGGSSWLQTGAMMDGYDDLLASGGGYLELVDHLFGTAAAGRYGTAISLLWTGLGFTAVSIVAGCLPVERGEKRSRANLIWVALGGGLALAMLLTVFARYGYLYQRQFVFGTPMADITNTLTNMTSKAALASELPLLLAAGALVMLPVLLMALLPRAADVGRLVDRHLVAARALAAAGLLGGATCWGASIWLSVSAQSLHMYHEYFDHHYAALSGNHFPLALYHAVPLAALILIAAGLILATPLLLTTRSNLAASGALVGPLLAVILVVVGLHGLSTARVERSKGPPCSADCSDLDRAAALYTLRPNLTYSQIDWWSLDLARRYLRDGQSLPRVHAEAHLEVTVSLVVHQSYLAVDGVKVLDLEGGTVYEEYRRGMMITPLYDVLVEKAYNAKALAARSPNNPFLGEINLLMDATTPMTLVLQILYTAGQAQFGDFRFVVQLPGRADDPRFRTLPIELPSIEAPPPHGTTPPRRWELAVTPDRLDLSLSGTDTAFSATEPGELAAQAGAWAQANGTPGQLYAGPGEGVTVERYLAAVAPLVDIFGAPMACGSMGAR